MRVQILRANALLLLVAFIWGTTFVAQRAGMVHLGPFTFNFVRFLLGAICLAPFAWSRRGREGRLKSPIYISAPIRGSLLAGTFLFAGISLQQIGLVTTTAANGGFITGLYVIVVPFAGFCFGMRIGPGVWAGAVLGVGGLYLLSFADASSFAPGDIWVFMGAFAWAGHVLAIGWISPRVDSFVLAFGQTFACAVMSFLAAVCFEEIRLVPILSAGWPLLFSGVITTGIAFTLQVVAQRHSPPAHAVLIMQLETVFAALSGWFFLGETMTGRGMVGCALILVGMMTAQFWNGLTALPKPSVSGVE